LMTWYQSCIAARRMFSRYCGKRLNIQISMSLWSATGSCSSTNIDSHAPFTSASPCPGRTPIGLSASAREGGWSMSTALLRLDRNWATARADRSRRHGVHHWAQAERQSHVCRCRERLLVRFTALPPCHGRIGHRVVCGLVSPFTPSTTLIVQKTGRFMIGWLKTLRVGRCGPAALPTMPADWRTRGHSWSTTAIFARRT